MARKLYLGGRYKKRYVVVDDEDYEYLRSMSWGATRITVWTKTQGRKHRPWVGYVQTTVRAFGKASSVFLHKIVAERKYGYKCPEGFQVDHINSNPKDNRRCNLRYIPREQNVRRTAIHGKGYYYNKDLCCWHVVFRRNDQFTKKSRTIFSRYCETENEARLAAYLYKRGYEIPSKRRNRKCRVQKQVG